MHNEQQKDTYTRRYLSPSCAQNRLCARDCIYSRCLMGWELPLNSHPFLPQKPPCCCQCSLASGQLLFTRGRSSISTRWRTRRFIIEQNIDKLREWVSNSQNMPAAILPMPLETLTCPPEIWYHKWILFGCKWSFNASYRTLIVISFDGRLVVVVVAYPS